MELAVKEINASGGILGKKIESYEMKMAALVILFPLFMVLGFTAIAAAGPGLEFVAPDTGEVKGNLNNPGAHGFSEILYAYSSSGNNNGGDNGAPGTPGAPGVPPGDTGTPVTPGPPGGTD